MVSKLLVAIENKPDEPIQVAKCGWNGRVYCGMSTELYSFHVSNSVLPPGEGLCQPVPSLAHKA